MQRTSTKNKETKRRRQISGQFARVGNRTKSSRSARRYTRKNLYPSIEPLPGFAPINVIASGYSNLLEQILQAPRKKRIKIVNALFRLLEAKKHVFDKEFFPHEGWKELVTYLLDSVQVYCGDIPLIMIEPDVPSNQFWFTNDAYHGSVEKETSLGLFEVAMLGRHEKQLHDLLVDAIAYLIKVKGIIYWANDGYGSDDLILENLVYTHDEISDRDNGPEEALKQRRAIRKAIERYTSGIPCDYEAKLSRVPQDIVRRVKKRLVNAACEDNEKVLWTQFLSITSCEETLNSYMSTPGEEEPVSVNYGFRVYWREDAMYYEQAEYINSCNNEYGTQELITSHMLIDKKGNIDWDINHHCVLPEMLKSFFHLFNSFLESKLKQYERPGNRKA